MSSVRVSGLRAHRTAVAILFNTEKTPPIKALPLLNSLSEGLPNRPLPFGGSARQSHRTILTPMGRGFLLPRGNILRGDVLLPEHRQDRSSEVPTRDQAEHRPSVLDARESLVLSSFFFESVYPGS